MSTNKNLNKMKIKVYKSGYLEKVITMTYSSKIEIELQPNYNDDGKEYYSILCDGERFFPEEGRAVVGRKAASKRLETMQQAYDNGQAEFRVDLN